MHTKKEGSGLACSTQEQKVNWLLKENKCTNDLSYSLIEIQLITAKLPYYTVVYYMSLYRFYYLL